MSPEMRQEITNPRIEEQTRVGLLESIRNAAQNRLAIAGIGLVAALGANEIAKAEGEAIASSPGAAASGLKQDCIKAALRKPKILRAEMLRPGDPKSQTIITEGRVAPTSSLCASLVTREVPQVAFEIQDPYKRKRWHRTGRMQGLKNEDFEPIKDQGGIGEIYFSPVLDIKNKKYLYRCTPGKGITGVRAVYKMEADSATDGQILGRKSYNIPIKVKPVRGPLKRKGSVRRAC